jgi:pyruvate ferredoxin oxidoreductase gamma subunit
MFQVRFHGRGGQGVVTAAELLSVAGFNEGKYAQAFPSFGSERMGAPVTSFCRLDDREIRTREPIMRPDALIIQDPTLLHTPGIFEGLSENGYVLINSAHPVSELRIEDEVGGLAADHVFALPATELALQFVGRPIPNAALLGAFAAATSVIHPDAVAAAIREKFSGDVADKNVRVVYAAYEMTMKARVPVGVGV